MKYIYLLFLTCVVFTISSCLDDKTNLDYSEILLPDSVFVTNVATGVRLKYNTASVVGNYSVKPGEELQLDADIFYRGNDEITCEWQFEGETISTEKNLRHIFTKEGTGMLLVFRKRAGNAECYQFSVNIRNPFSTGVVVLGKDKGAMKLDYVERYYEKKVPIEFAGNKYSITLYQFVKYDDVYAMNNEGERLALEEPIKLFRYGGFNYETGILNGIQILDKSWQNSLCVNSINMQKLVSMQDEFVAVPQNFRPVDFINIGAMSLVLDKSGKIYTRVNYDYGNPSTGRFSSIPLGYDDPYDVPDQGTVDVNATCFAKNSNPMVLIYEKEKKRFLVMTAVSRKEHNLDYCYMSDLSRPKNVDNLPKGYVDMNNFNKELISIIMPAGYSDDVYILFKDDGEFYMQVCTINVDIYNMPHRITYTAKSCVKLSANIAQLLMNGGNCFRMGSDSKYNDIIYFSSGNAIYVMDPSGNELKKIFEFEQKDRITNFYIMMPWHEDGVASAVNRYYNGRVFSASFDNGDFKVVKMYDDPEKPGEVQYSYWVDKHYDGGVFDILYY